MPPRSLFRAVARAEAVTWALLLTGMFLKYVTETTELGVRVFGLVHGVVFVAYVVVALAVAVDQRWSARRLLLGLAAAVPPFLTLWFERYAGQRGAVGDTWRLTHTDATSAPERLVGWLVRNPVLGTGAGLTAVAALTGVALLIGPPVG